jgi:DNA-binding Lrp family transcriptional regulator
MHAPLTAIDIKILEALCEHSPRNLSKVAKVVGISRYALEFRLRRMKSSPQIFLKMFTSIYHTRIGLKKAVVFIEAQPGMEQFLFEILKINGFWLYICRSYGMGEGCTAVYAVPADHCNEFEEFIYAMKRLGVATRVKIFWSTCFQGGRITSTWFDSQRENWIFSWEEWIREVQTQKTDLPYTLMEPKSYSICADEIDVQMLMWLESDATKSIKEIAETLGIDRQRAHYHYKKHLLERNLIEGFEIFVMRYGDNPFVMAYFILSFHNYETFAKFTKSLLNKFFVLTMGKVLGENALIVEIFLPTGEFRNFIDTLSTMAKMKLVKSYKYAIQDLRRQCRQTFSGEFFRDDSWIYDHKNHMKKLQQEISTVLQ